MKKIFLFIVGTICFVTNFFGQTAVIECNTVGESCTNPNPETFIIYTTRVIDNGEGWSFQSATWVATPAAAVVSQSPNGTQFEVKWANINNSTQKKVQVTVTAQKTVNGNTTTKSLSIVQQNVTVKYISPITHCQSVVVVYQLQL